MKIYKVHFNGVIRKSFLTYQEASEYCDNYYKDAVKRGEEIYDCGVKVVNE